MWYDSQSRPTGPGREAALAEREKKRKRTEDRTDTCLLNSDAILD
jgi:hypothetical protein